MLKLDIALICLLKNNDLKEINVVVYFFSHPLRLLEQGKEEKKLVIEVG